MNKKNSILKIFDDLMEQKGPCTEKNKTQLMIAIKTKCQELGNDLLPRDLTNKMQHCQKWADIKDVIKQEITNRPRLKAMFSTVLKEFSASKVSHADAGVSNAGAGLVTSTDGQVTDDDRIDEKNLDVHIQNAIQAINAFIQEEPRSNINNIRLYKNTRDTLIKAQEERDSDKLKIKELRQNLSEEIEELKQSEMRNAVLVNKLTKVETDLLLREHENVELKKKLEEFDRTNKEVLEELKNVKQQNERIEELQRSHVELREQIQISWLRNEEVLAKVDELTEVNRSRKNVERSAVCSIM